MTIKDIRELQTQKLQIDLLTAKGNAFVLLGYAKKYCIYQELLEKAKNNIQT